MRDNTRVGEKFEVALDGRQIASVVVGALVLLGVVFVLGYNVGRQVGGRPDRVPGPGTLAALDEAGQAEKTTFWDQLPKNRPARPPSGPAPGAPPDAAPSRPAQEPAVATPAAPPADAQPVLATPTAPATPPALAEAAPPEAALAAASSGAGTPVTASAVAEPPAAHPAQPAPTPAAARPERRGTFTVQVGATQSRADADRLAARFAGRGARIVEGEAAGIGKVWRVRVGSFADRAGAVRLAEQLARETGVKGFVTPVQ